MPRISAEEARNQSLGLNVIELESLVDAKIENALRVGVTTVVALTDKDIGKGTHIHHFVRLRGVGPEAHPNLTKLIRLYEAAGYAVELKPRSGTAGDYLDQRPARILFSWAGA